jgi:hypothetical protein
MVCNLGTCGPELEGELWPSNGGSSSDFWIPEVTAGGRNVRMKEVFPSFALNPIVLDVLREY